jgi:hypothetical protein
VVRVAPPVLDRLEMKWPKPDRRAFFALETLLGVCLTVGFWLGSWLWLQSLSNELKVQREANWKAVLKKFKNEVLVPFKKQMLDAQCPLTPVRLKALEGSYRSAVNTCKRVPQGPQDLQVMLDPEDLQSERGEEFVILWGTPLSPTREQDFGVLLAYERTSDKTGRRYVLLGDATVLNVTEQEFQKLFRGGRQ